MQHGVEPDSLRLIGSRHSRTIPSLQTELIVFGGCLRETECSSDVSVFQTRNATWYTPAVKQRYIPAPRGGHSATVVGGSRVYIIGGNTIEGYRNDVFVLNGITKLWSKPVVLGASLPPERADHTAVEYKGKIYVLGGSGEQGLLDDFWQLNTRSHTWSKVPVSDKSFVRPPPMALHTAVVIGDKMYVYGGRTERDVTSDIYVFDFVTSTWSKPFVAGAVPLPRHSHHASARDNRYIFIMGGCNVLKNECYSESFIFDTKDMQWVVPAEAQPYLPKDYFNVTDPFDLVTSDDIPKRLPEQLRLDGFVVENASSKKRADAVIEEYIKKDKAARDLDKKFEAAAAEEAKKKAVLEAAAARIKAEEDAKKKAEEDAKKKAEEDAKKKAEAEAKKKAEAEAKKKAADDKAQKAKKAAQDEAAKATKAAETKVASAKKAVEKADAAAKKTAAEAEKDPSKKKAAEDAAAAAKKAADDLAAAEKEATEAKAAAQRKANDAIAAAEKKAAEEKAAIDKALAQQANATSTSAPPNPYAAEAAKAAERAVQWAKLAVVNPAKAREFDAKVRAEASKNATAAATTASKEAQAKKAAEEKAKADQRAIEDQLAMQEKVAAEQAAAAEKAAEQKAAADFKAEQERLQKQKAEVDKKAAEDSKQLAVLASATSGGIPPMSMVSFLELEAPLLRRTRRVFVTDPWFPDGAWIERPLTDEELASEAALNPSETEQPSSSSPTTVVFYYVDRQESQLKSRPVTSEADLAGHVVSPRPASLALADALLEQQTKNTTTSPRNSSSAEVKTAIPPETFTWNGTTPLKFNSTDIKLSDAEMAAKRKAHQDMMIKLKLPKDTAIPEILRDPFPASEAPLSDEGAKTKLRPIHYLRRDIERALLNDEIQPATPSVSKFELKPLRPEPAMNYVGGVFGNGLILFGGCRLNDTCTNDVYYYLIPEKLELIPAVFVESSIVESIVDLGIL